MTDRDDQRPDDTSGSVATLTAARSGDQTDGTGGLGLRERKRIATSRAIQLAVLELARDRGLDQVTVDEVSRVANISPRTFFNYFPSKEAAMVGERELVVDSELIDGFVAAGPDADVFDGLLVLMQAMASGDADDRDLHQLRRYVLRDYPELFVLKIATMRSFEQLLADIVERRLVADEGPGDAADVGVRAKLIAMICITTMRHAWGCWADSDDRDSLAAKLAHSFEQLKRVV